MIGNLIDEKSGKIQAQPTQRPAPMNGNKNGTADVGGGIQECPEQSIGLHDADQYCERCRRHRGIRTMMILFRAVWRRRDSVGASGRLEDKRTWSC